MNEHIKESIGKVLQPVAISMRSGDKDNELKESTRYDPYAGKNSTFSLFSVFFLYNFEKPKYGTIATESPPSSPTPMERFKNTRIVFIPEIAMSYL